VKLLLVLLGQALLLVAGLLAIVLR